MERTVALKKLGALLGKDFGWRINPKACTREEREEAKLALPALSAAARQAETAAEDRRKAVLAADEEYQRLRREWIEARRASGDASSKTHSYRFTVGNSVAGMFFSVKAEGDSWEEVIEKLRK
jgi:hypothetical protein